MENTGARTAEQSPWILTCALALDADRLVAGAIRGDLDDWDAENALFALDRGAWTRLPAEKGVVGLAALPDADGGERVFALWKNGRVQAFSPSAGPGGTREEEWIDRVVPRNVRKKTYGELTCLRRIGGALFACGASGQVYRRDSHGAWAHFDEGVLERGSVEGSDLRVAAAIAGSSEEDLYVLVGEFRTEGLVPRVLHHDGKAWSRLDVPADQVLNDIHVEDEEHVYFCGMRSTVLAGNHRRGFGPVVPGVGPHALMAVTLFRDTLFMASNYGIVRHDPMKRRLLKVRTELAREPGSMYTTTAAQGALWFMGQRELVRFDGEAWSRVELPR